MPQHKVSAGIHRQTAHLNLILRGRVVLFLAPVEADNDNRVLFLRSGNVFWHLIPKRVVAVDAQVAEHGDLDALDFHHADVRAV